MKKVALIPTTLLLSTLLLLASCQKKAEEATAADETTPQETTAQETTAQETTPEKPTTNAETETKDIKDLAAVKTPGPVPAGYTLVAPLTDKPVRVFKSEPAMALQDGKDYYALFDTSKGQILVDLYEQETPVTVNNFVTLARNHFYDGTRFHRVIEGFMAQGGDPQSADDAKKDVWGTGDPGYKFADEIRSKLSFNGAGILAMANSGANTNGSQFFITFADTSHLNGKHTIFGKVVTGDDVLPKLTRTQDESGAPSTATPDDLLSVRILTKG